MSAARAGLLLLLPVIAVAVYVDGQSYDPATRRFDPSGELGVAALLAPQMAGLAMEGRPRVYVKENLFEHVDGHAEFFISLGFKSLTVAEYSTPPAPPGKPEYTVEVYDMGAAQNAFGALAQESGGLSPEAVGDIGYSSSRSVMFIQGAYYVKVDSFGQGEKLPGLAGAMASALPQGGQGLAQFAVFPPQGALAGGRSFKREDYMGLDIFRDVFEQEYERDGQTFFAFTLSTGAASADYLETLKRSIEQTGAIGRPAEYGQAPGLLVEDRYEGTWAVAQVGSRVIGARGLAGAALERFMEEMAISAEGK